MKAGRKNKGIALKLREDIRTELLLNPFESHTEVAIRLKTTRQTVGIVAKDMDAELLEKITSATKLDDLLSYTKVLNYLTTVLVEVIEGTNRDAHKIMAAKVLHHIYEKSLMVKLELGIHQKPAQIIDVKVSAKDKAQFDQVFGGVLNNLHSVEQIQNAIEGARRLEAASSGQRSSAGDIEKKIRNRIAQK